MKGSGGGAPPSSRLALRRRGYWVLSYSNYSAHSMNKTKQTKALRQVGWLCLHQHQSFIRMRWFYEPKLAQTQSSLSGKASCGKPYSSRSVALPRAALSSSLSGRLSSRLSRRLSSMLPRRLSRSSRLCCGIAVMTADRYGSITGRQPYIVPYTHAHISMNRL